MEQEPPLPQVEQPEEPALLSGISGSMLKPMYVMSMVALPIWASRLVSMQKE